MNTRPKRRIHRLTIGYVPEDDRTCRALDAVPRLRVPMSGVDLCALEEGRFRVAAFLLAQVDGVSSIESLIDITAASQAEVLELISRWMAEGVLELTSPSTPNDPREDAVTIVRRSPAMSFIRSTACGETRH
jgi:hypothetical protein